MDRREAKLRGTSENGQIKRDLKVQGDEKCWTTRKGKNQNQKKGKMSSGSIKGIRHRWWLFLLRAYTTANGSRRKLWRVVGVNKKVEEEKELNKPTNWSGTWLGI
jgi:hypothetical protein